MCELKENETVMLVSDGVYDNLDARHLGLLPQVSLSFSLFLFFSFLPSSLFDLFSRISKAFKNMVTVGIWFDSSFSLSLSLSFSLSPVLPNSFLFLSFS